MRYHRDGCEVHVRRLLWKVVERFWLWYYYSIIHLPKWQHDIKTYNYISIRVLWRGLRVMSQWLTTSLICIFVSYNSYTYLRLVLFRSLRCVCWNWLIQDQWSLWPILTICYKVYKIKLYIKLWARINFTIILKIHKWLLFSTFFWPSCMAMTAILLPWLWQR